MKVTLNPKPRQRKGVISITAVLAVGIFCLALTVATYRSTMRSLDIQRKVQLQLDYEAREQAFLRAVVSLAPVHAANTMIDGSQGTNDDSSFQSLYEEAGKLSSFSKTIDTDNYADIVADLQLSDARSLNVADSDYDSALEYVGAAAIATVHLELWRPALLVTILHRCLSVA